MFAVSFWLAEHTFAIGTLDINGTENLPLSFDDYYYFSMVNFTTLGRGDLIPSDYLRFITAIEAFVGFVLITTSSAFLLNILSRKSSIAVAAVHTNKS